MILTILIFILTLGVLVISHELGHFLAARRFGIKVLEFGFGIPPKIFGKKIGDTVYSLNALPVGGFVRLLGEDEVSTKVLDDPRSFAHQNVWKRIVVVIAGVTMNLILAWILFYIVIAGQGFKVIYPTPNPGVTIEGADQNSPAQAAGVKGGEQILEINKQSVLNISDATKIIKSNPEKQIELKVSNLDGSNVRTIEVTPGKDGRIGVILSELPLKIYRTPSEKIFSGVTYSFDLIKLTFLGFGQLFNNLSAQKYDQASASIAGPVGIAVTANSILSLGQNALIPYLWFMGVLSLTLSIMNILPIPALDGGRLLFLLIEAVAGKKVNATAEKWIHTGGMAVLLTLIAFITYLDIKRFILH